MKFSDFPWEQLKVGMPIVGAGGRLGKVTDLEELQPEHPDFPISPEYHIGKEQWVGISWQDGRDLDCHEHSWLDSCSILKAISLWQPWASAIAIGSKKIETRSWKTKYRGPLIIHAAKKWNKDLRTTTRLLHKKGVPLPIDEAGCGLPLGSFVCLVDLVDCVEMTNKWIKKQGKIERLLGDYKPGRWGWILENVRAINPIPAKGRQGFWTVTHSIKTS